MGNPDFAHRMIGSWLSASGMTSLCVDAASRPLRTNVSAAPERRHDVVEGRIMISSSLRSDHTIWTPRALQVHLSLKSLHPVRKQRLYRNPVSRYLRKRPPVKYLHHTTPISPNTSQSFPTQSDHPHQTSPRPSNPNQAPRRPGQPCSSTERRSPISSARHTLRKPRGNQRKERHPRSGRAYRCVPGMRERR